MNKLVMSCVFGLVLMTGACAHKHGGGCKDGSCKMEKAAEHKECGCGHDHDAKSADVKANSKVEIKPSAPTKK